MKLHDFLRSAGHYAYLVPTPQGIANGCSMSVKIEESALVSARAYIRERSLSTFIGAYELYDTFSPRRLF